MRVADGPDYLEFMLTARSRRPRTAGSAHHICLRRAGCRTGRWPQLEARPARAGYTRPIAVRTGINRKRQVNLFDPDGTRVELMEPDTVDGKPAPSSTLPPPRELH